MKEHVSYVIFLAHLLVLILFIIFIITVIFKPDFGSGVYRLVFHNKSISSEYTNNRVNAGQCKQSDGNDNFIQKMILKISYMRTVVPTDARARARTVINAYREERADRGSTHV